MMGGGVNAKNRQTIQELQQIAAQQAAQLAEIADEMPQPLSNRNLLPAAFAKALPATKPVLVRPPPILGLPAAFAAGTGPQALLSHTQPAQPASSQQGAGGVPPSSRDMSGMSDEEIAELMAQESSSPAPIENSASAALMAWNPAASPAGSLPYGELAASVPIFVPTPATLAVPNVMPMLDPLPVLSGQGTGVPAISLDIDPLLEVNNRSKPGALFPGRMTGLVKQCDDQSGFACIACRQCMILFKRDVFIRATELRSVGAQIGSQVNFLVFMNKDISPEAADTRLCRNITIVDSSASSAAPAIMNDADAAIAQDAETERQAAEYQAATEAAERMQYESYAAMLQAQYSSVMSGNYSGEGKDGKDAEANGAAYAQHDPHRRFTGTVGGFRDYEGFGYIKCPEAFKIYGRDVFLHRSELGYEHDLHKKRGANIKINVGDVLSFIVDVVGGKAKAKRIEFVSQADPDANVEEKVNPPKKVDSASGFAFSRGVGPEEKRRRF